MFCKSELPPTFLFLKIALQGLGIHYLVFIILLGPNEDHVLCLLCTQLYIYLMNTKGGYGKDSLHYRKQGWCQISRGPQHGLANGPLSILFSCPHLQLLTILFPAVAALSILCPLNTLSPHYTILELTAPTPRVCIVLANLSILSSILIPPSSAWVVLFWLNKNW